MERNHEQKVEFERHWITFSSCPGIFEFFHLILTLSTITVCQFHKTNQTWWWHSNGKRHGSWSGQIISETLQLHIQSNRLQQDLGKTVSERLLVWNYRWISGQCKSRITRSLNHLESLRAEEGRHRTGRPDTDLRPEPCDSLLLSLRHIIADFHHFAAGSDQKQ